MQKSYLAVGPDAVLTSRKPTDLSASQSMAPNPRRKSYMDAAGPRSSRGQLSTRSAALPAVSDKAAAGQLPPVASAAARVRRSGSPRASVTRAAAGSPGAGPAAVQAQESQASLAAVPASEAPVPKKKHVAIAAEAADKEGLPAVAAGSRASSTDGDRGASGTSKGGVRRLLDHE